MKIEINEGTPFLADITAADGGKRYRLIVEDEGAAALYMEVRDDFGQPHWQGATNIGDYHDVVARIIVRLSQRGLDGPISTETRPVEDQELI